MAAPPTDADSPRPATEQEFAQYLCPSVEEAVRFSVKSDPRVMADALFPAIGPAIRQAITSAWNDMVEALSVILNQAFSPRGLRWRWEAFRTGQPLGEIAYYHSLLYAVEQVLLIHRKTGLLLHQVAAETVGPRDNESIAGMLTAIQDFAHDSFRVNDGTGLEALRLGELTVWVEQGPEAVLAAVIRRQPPPELRYAFRDVLERIHQKLGRELLMFSGDSQPFAECETIMRSCLVSQLRAPRKPSRTPALVVLAALAALVAVGAGFYLYKRHRWNVAVAAFEGRPGFAVTRSKWAWSGSVIEGLRDPLAENPEAVLRSVNADPADVPGKWKPFLSLDPEIVLARARLILAPPEGVKLTLAGDVLEATGSAPAAWVAESRGKAPQIPGVREIRFSEEWKARIEQQRLHFAPGASQPDETEAALDALAASIRAAPGRVEIVGHADASGPEAYNNRLSMARARSVASALVARGVPASKLEPVIGGIGQERVVRFRAVEAGDGGARP